MKHQVDQQGNITLSPTSREIELIAKSIISRNLQMRLDRTCPGTYDELVKLMQDINDAQVLRNKTLMNLRPSMDDEGPAIIRIPESVLSNDSVFEQVDKLLNPSWTTADFESAKMTSATCDYHQITSMKFAENAPNHPIQVKGLVQVAGHLYKASWDSWGRCKCDDLLKDQWSDFDLIRPGQRKLDASKFIAFAFVATLFGLLIYGAYLIIQ